MRVLTVARWYPSHDSPGRGSFVADLVRATAAAGAECRVVSFDRVLVRGPLEERDQVLATARAAYERVATPEALFVTPRGWGAPGCPVARLPMVRRPGSDDAAALIEDHLAALAPFVRRLAGTWHPDVIHAHTGLPDGVVAAEVGRALGIPVVVSEHMSTIEDALADPLALERYRGLLGPGVRLVAVSPSLADRTATLLDVAAASIGVLPNPVSDAAFPLADRGARRPEELLWVGSVGEHKGIDVLLEAFALVRTRRPAARLRIVGGERAAGERARWEALAGSLGIGAAVAFEGWLPRDQVARAMAEASVFVHPSPSETFGVAAAEAILTGLPVAARRSGGVPWIIELSGGFGRVAEGDDAPALARAIDTVLGANAEVDPATARERLIDLIGDAAVARRAMAIYAEAGEAGEAASAGGAPVAPSVSPPGRIDPRAPGPVRVLVATGRDHGVRLVAGLPDALQRGLSLVVPPPPARTPTSDPLPPEPPVSIGIVQALPVPPLTPKPKGRGAMARLRRAFWRPPPTAEQQLAGAIVAAARAHRTGRGKVDVVAIDAPAAALIVSLRAPWLQLAPGTLRWLADRWDANDREGP